MILAIVHYPSGDLAVKYEGMDTNAVNQMMADLGVTCTVVDQSGYDAFIATNPAPVPKPPVVPPAILALKAILSNPLSTTDQKITALLSLLSARGVV